MKRYVFLASLVAVVGLVSACGGGGSSPGGSGGTGGTVVTLTHDGFDFSTGAVGSASGYDGETVGWQPDGGVHPLYPNNAEWVWWRNGFAVGSATNQSKDMGMVTLDSVTSVPGSWDASPDILPLLVGHVIVARCADGYVKFRVESVSDGNVEWTAQVTYVHSSSMTFP